MDTPYATELQTEERGWYEIAELVRELTPRNAWPPATTAIRTGRSATSSAISGRGWPRPRSSSSRCRAGTYAGHDIDIDALNAVFLAALQGQPWDVVWTQANAARSRMRQAWAALPEPNDEAAWWIRKSAVEHYGQHLARLREWVGELVAPRRAAG